MIRRGINYLFRFDQRLLILSSLQITPSWAAFHHSGNSWFFGVTKKSLSASQASVRFVKLLNDIRSFIFPREIVPWIGLAILVAYIIPASVRFGVKYLNISFERVRNKYRTNKIKLSNDKIKVRLPRKLANKKINFSIRKNHAMRKSVYTILKRVVCLESDHFDSDSTNFEYGATSCVLDNSANSHIWNKKEDFVRGTLHPLKELASVATIGGSNFYPKGIGDLNVKIRDDNNMTSELVLKNVLYFPNSPVNIISVVCLADHFNDDHGTSVLTARNTSVLIWDNSKFSKTLRHSNNRLPEISVNEGVCSGENVKIKNLPQASTYCTSKTILPEDLYDSTKAFLDSTDLFSLFAGSDRRATRELLHTNQDAIFDAALKEKLIQAEQYKIGDTVRYTKDGCMELATYEDIEFENLDEAPKYKLRLDGSQREIITDKEFVSPIDVPDISDTNLSERQIKSLFENLSGNEIKQLFSRDKHDVLYQEFLAWHEKLGHLSKSIMFKMCENGELPAKFLALKDKTIICPSCVIGNMKKKPWRYKNDSSTIRKIDEDFPGACVSVDQLVSKQPGLVPRQDGKHSLHRITGATVYHDHFTNFTYSHLQTSLDTDQTIASKTAFESKENSFGVKIKSYHADNGIFSEKGFRDAVTASN